MVRMFIPSIGAKRPIRVRGVLYLSVIVPLFFVAKGQAEEMNEEECSRLHPEIVSPVEMTICTSDLEGSRTRLNTAYRSLIDVLSQDSNASSKAAIQLLDKSQKSWLSFRNAQCKYETGGMDGTIESSDEVACMENMNRIRAAYLEGEVSRRK